MLFSWNKAIIIIIIIITIPHYSIKVKLLDSVEQTFTRECSLYLPNNEKLAFFHFWRTQNYKSYTLTYLFDNMFIRYGNKFNRYSNGDELQICFCLAMPKEISYLSEENQADIIEAFNSTSTGYNMNVMHAAWLLTQSHLTTLLPSLIRASYLMMAPAYSFQLSWLGLDALSLVAPPGFNYWTSVAPAFQSWSCCWVPVSFHLWWILIYKFGVLMHWWVEVLHADRTTWLFMNHSRI